MGRANVPVGMDGKLIAELPIGAGQKVVVQVKDFKGKRYVDIRRFVDVSLSPLEKKFVPTKKGISIPIALLNGVVEALSKVQEGLTAEELCAHRGEEEEC